MHVRPEKLAEYYKQKYPLTFAKIPIDKELMERYEKAWNIAKEAAKILKQDFGASKVAVFGSLTDLSAFTLWSDVDLAVWGVPESRFYAAVGAVTGLPSDFQIDVIDATDCRERLTKSIESEGVEL
ncbi:MAG TPA: nucleotidyltransferase domain-containing protein [Firmicutes bacterium]|nr:nucleotidyltransferase domain-containing protein [Bacillota bacterium]